MAQAAQVIQLLTDTAGSFIQSEALSAAASAIVPGMLIEELAAGTVQEHSAAGGNAQKLFALSDLSNAGTIDTAYPVGANVRYGCAHSGQEVYGWVADGATAITKGAPLQSAGDGTLELWVAQAVDEGGAATLDIAVNSIVAYALEAVDNSAGDALVRIKARVA